MAVDASGTVYVSNYGSNSVSVLSDTGVIATMLVGGGPEEITVDDVHGQVYVVNTMSNTLSVIRGTQVVATYAVGLTPRTVAYNPASDTIYVGNYEDASLSIFGPQPADPPLVDFVGAPRSGAEPLTVNFTSTVTNTVSSYYWMFGDGGTALTPNAAHLYNGGLYEVTLVVTGPGGTASEAKPAYITIAAADGAPSATFTTDTAIGHPPLAVNFTAVTSGAIDNWVWQFGDGIISAMPLTAAHVYTALGSYDPFLTVSNANGSYTYNPPGKIVVEPYRVYLALVRR
jgi:YVTN family beta-propeller protein